jgi:hypothetical protein
VLVATIPQKLSIQVEPVADAIMWTTVYAIEDNGAVPFGAILANRQSGIRLNDRAQGKGNNPEPETILQIVISVPPDSNEVTYLVSGTFVPQSDGIVTGEGTGVVSFDLQRRTFTIRSSLLTNRVNLAAADQETREQADKDIRATLAAFYVEIGPTHTDIDGDLSVTVTTLDVQMGFFDTTDVTFKPIKLQAVADQPSITVQSAAQIVSEDGDLVPLYFTVGRSADEDGSENLKVLISVPLDELGPIGSITGSLPVGVLVINEGPGLYLISSSATTPIGQETSLNQLFDGQIKFHPRNNFSGQYLGSNGIRVDVFMEERATNDQLAPVEYGLDGDSKLAKATGFIDIFVLPDADKATVLVKGNAAGMEDKPIPVPLSVTLGDLDGSESYSMEIVDNLPAGAKLLGSTSRELLSEDGVFFLFPIDVESLILLPPLHWSSAKQGDIVLLTNTTTVDISPQSSSSASVYLSIPIKIVGVADKPNTRPVVVHCLEDGTYNLGSSIGDLSGVLVDVSILIRIIVVKKGSPNLLCSFSIQTDGSEVLSLVLSGLPLGVVPQSEESNIQYLGKGRWQVPETAIPSLTLPALPNFSGDNPYTGITINAVSQELDRDQAVSDSWPVTIKVRPVVDGFASWSMSFTTTEGMNEANNGGIDFKSVKNFVLGDEDNSEAVISFTFDFSNLMVNAGIRTRLNQLEGQSAGLEELVSKRMDGEFTFDQESGTVLVLSENIENIKLHSELFLDSNQNFEIPVNALVRDSAVSDGSSVREDKIKSGVLFVIISGTADIPTVFAEPTISGSVGESGIPVRLGGETTDRDVSLGRTQSEDVYYLVSTSSSSISNLFTFSGAGLNNGDGHWTLEKSDLAGLQVYFSPSIGMRNQSEASFDLTAVAVEDDGDWAVNTTTFKVILQPNEAGDTMTIPPLPPLLAIGLNAGLEDTKISLGSISAVVNPDDPTNSTISVAIWSIPPNAKVFGARLNPTTGKWICSAASINSGAVQILPGPDYSGSLMLTIQAIATNQYALSAHSPEQKLEFIVDPVADGAAISISPSSGLEDEMVSLRVSLTELDVDGSERIGHFAYIKMTNGATLIGNYTVVTEYDNDAFIGTFSNAYSLRVPSEEISELSLKPAANWHGTITLEISVPVVERFDDEDGDHVKVARK